MARKKIFDNDAAKISVVFDGKNKKFLDTLVDETDTKYSPLINKIISLFYNLSPMLKEVIQTGILNKMDELTLEVEHTKDILHLKNCEKNLRDCQDILTLINGKKYDQGNFRFKEISMNNGTLVIPRDWIILNPEDSTKKYVGVIECRHSFKFEIPHFAFFTDEELPINYNEEYFKELCVAKWPKFQEVIDAQVEPILDPDVPGKCLNFDEFFASPIIGFFKILDDLDPLFDNDPPYGAFIKRTKEF